MAKKRTKKDKQKASLRKRQVQVVQSVGDKVVKKPTVLIEKKEQPLLLQTDHVLIRQDLRKTVIITLFILLVLFTIALLYT